ncbi:MAG: glycine--tRNA ligase, partial [Clostridiaceae bacterium]|nr:glycine--tRNA ligase [Clostridiaceae bacterium]
MASKQHALAKIVALAGNRGFVYQGSEIYGGLANSWDYGPYGTSLKQRIKEAWWKRFVDSCPLNVGLDSSILMNPDVWVASGHVGGFSDPMIDCRNCRTRWRADQLIDDWNRKQGFSLSADGWTNEEYVAYIREHGIVCPACGKHDFTDVRQFNLMFKTFLGVTE